MKTTSSKSFYNWFYFLYPLVNIFFKQPKNRLTRSINKLPKGKLLEIGAGRGEYLNNYKHEIIAIDNSEKMLSHAKRCSHPNIKIYEMDAHDLLFEDSSFDYVVLSFVIAVVEKPNVVLEEIHRVLKPNGTLFILNHFPPQNILGRIDKFFSKFSNILNFNSAFNMEDLSSINKFALTKNLSLGLGNYYKLLTYLKK